MRILSFDELTDDDINNCYNFACINMQDKNVFMLVSELTESDCRDIVDMLNAINNQGILEINKDALYYTIQDKHQEKKLPLSCMSTSEAVFLICALADKLKVHVILSNDIYQLTRRTIKTFNRFFKNSKYITLVFENEFDAGYYKKFLFGGGL